MTEHKEPTAVEREAAEDLVLRFAKTVHSLLDGQDMTVTIAGIDAVLKGQEAVCACSLAYVMLEVALPEELVADARAQFGVMAVVVEHPVALVLGLMTLGAATYAATIRAGGPELFAAKVAMQTVP